MLSKKYRLSREEIGLIHKKGRRLNMGGIGVKCLANNIGYSRFAVNVPLSVSKKATERNRIRRLVYDEIGKNKVNGTRPPARQGVDCLIGIYRKIDEKALRDITRKICLNI